MENNSNKSLPFIRNYTLVNQTPIIHFQPDQIGATLRATEVKPKMDKFLIRKAEKDNVDLKGLFVGETLALNYKMRIKKCVGEGEKEKVSLDGKGDYDIYYGNMGSDKKKKGISDNAEITITCFKPQLLEFIDEYIGEFFAVTNFGTMSNKGFGSFCVAEKKMDEKQISAALKDRYGAEKCYRISSVGKPFKQIKTVYSILKSGINFNGYQRSLLFLYMHGKGFGNEKAWLKQQGIAPALGRKSDQHDKCSYYVRALLGVGERIEFLKSQTDRRGKVGVKISDSEKQIERLPSPIIFKVIGNSIYMVANRIDNDIYGKMFTFKSDMGKGELRVPTIDELGGEGFIDEFLEYAVGELNKGIADKFVKADKNNPNNSVTVKEV